MASIRRPWRVIGAWGAAVLVSLFLAVTMLHGLTTDAHVVGPTQSSQAQALYDKALGGAVTHEPTDVIVLSSSTATVSDPAFRATVGTLAAQVATMPGISSVRVGLTPGSPCLYVTAV